MFDYISIDVEADGPNPGTEDYSMISLGAIHVWDQSKTFYSELAPISDKWVPEALAVSKFTREQTLQFDDAQIVMARFALWLSQFQKPRFVSDNAGFDWMFVCWYLNHFTGTNPFGHSSTSLTSMYKGMEKTMKANFKRLRETRHTHNALDDAKSNATAMVKMQRLGMRF